MLLVYLWSIAKELNIFAKRQDDPAQGLSFFTNLLSVDGDDTWENRPDDNLIAWRGRQAAWVGEVVPWINSLDELAKVDVAQESRIGLGYALNVVGAKLKKLILFYLKALFFVAMPKENPYVKERPTQLR